ncbi:MAG TPA: hypothetical protein VF845_06735 [Terriglobales bacterium]
MDSHLGRVTQLAEQARAAAKSEWIRCVQSALALADYGRVAELLSQGKSKFPGDREVSEFERKLQDGLELRAKAQKIIADGRAALGKRKWEKAADYLTRACEVAAGDPAVQEQVLSELLEGCEAALDVDCPAAEMLLARAAQIQPNSPLLSALRAHIENQKREQMIEQHITAAVREQSGGDWQGALRQLEQGLSVYPNEPRLSQVKRDIETRLRQLEEEQQGRREAEKERARQVELERQRQIELKRQQELERERAKAAEQRKLARAHELEEKAEQERTRQRQAEQQRQQELERKRQQEAERERATAAEHEGEIARARELELTRQQERTREKELDRQREAERKRREEEQRAREKAEKKRQLEALKLAEQARRREEGLKQSEPGKTIVMLPTQVLKNTRLLVIGGGALLLAVVLFMVWILTPRAVPVEITTTPVGTTVRIKATGEECVTPRCTIKLRPGKYEMEFSHQGYETKSQSISVQAKGPNPISIALPAIVVVVNPPSPPTKPARMQIHGWKRGAGVYLDGKLLGPIGPRGTFSASVTAADHEIKVVDKNGESGIMHKSFAAGESADLAKGDFALGSPLIPPPPALSPEDHDWQQVKDSGNIAELEKFRGHYPKNQHQSDLEEKLDNLYWDKAKGASNLAAFDEYLAKSPNGKHRGEAQENVAWGKAEASNTAQAFQGYRRQYPQGPRFELAGQKIEDLRFQAAQNSEDEALLLGFLKDYPSGTPHDQISGRLDDVVWRKTRKDDLAGLQAYVARFPGGRHLSQARTDIEELTPPPPKISKEPPKPVVDERAAVLRVIAQYNQAYNDRNIDALKRIWPTMDSKQIASMRDFFRMVSSVTSTYQVDQDPQFNGDEAIVRWTLTFSYVLNGKEVNQKPSRVIMTLKKKQSPDSGAVWQIQSVVGK